MKTKDERRAEALGFDIYYDLNTGLMRSSKSKFKEFLLVCVLTVHYVYRRVMWYGFYKLVEIEIKMHAEEGETAMGMYEKMDGLINKE